MVAVMHRMQCHPNPPAISGLLLRHRQAPIAGRSGRSPAKPLAAAATRPQPPAAPPARQQQRGGGDRAPLPSSSDHHSRPAPAAAAAPPPPPPPATPSSSNPIGAAVTHLAASLPPFDGRLRGLVLLNIMTLLMGSNWAVIKMASGDAGTLTDATSFMALRFALAAAVFLPFLRLDARLARGGVQIGLWYSAGGLKKNPLGMAVALRSAAGLAAVASVAAAGRSALTPP
jgi:hypothetical protein